MQSIPKDQIVRRMRAENPWWQEPHEVLPVYSGWTPRPYLDLFYPLIRERAVRRAVVLMGPRRVGKTVLIQHTMQRLLAEGTDVRAIAYFSVDHPLYNGLSLESLVELFSEVTGLDPARQPSFLFFDEIQYLKDWERHLKVLVDSYPELRVVACGSAAAALKLKSRESGAGRFTEFLLPPLTFYEFLTLLGEDPRESLKDLERLNKNFIRYLNFGGYPEASLSPAIQADPGRFIKADIIDKVLLRDLPSLYGIQDIQELNSLFTTLAFNTAQEISLEELSQSAEVAKNTIKKYIEYLEAAFLVKVVHRVDQKGRRFKRANFFKVYLTNPSMRAALFTPVEEGDPALGALVETAVLAQWFHVDAPLYYARWRRGEVDLVGLDARGKIRWASEVKWSDRLQERLRELASVLDFCRRNRLERFTITTRTFLGNQDHGGVTVQFVPAARYCLAAGSFTVTEGGRKLMQPRSID